MATWLGMVSAIVISDDSRDAVHIVDFGRGGPMCLCFGFRDSARHIRVE